MSKTMYELEKVRVKHYSGDSWDEIDRKEEMLNKSSNLDFLIGNAKHLRLNHGKTFYEYLRIAQIVDGEVIDYPWEKFSDE